MKRKLLLAIVMLPVFGMYLGWPEKRIEGMNARFLAAAGTPTQFLWDYDYTQATNKPCSTTVTASCVSGFTVQVTNAAGAVVAGPTAVANPATPSTTGATVGIATPFTPPSSLGEYTITVIVNWKDSSGTAQAGPSAGLSFPVTPTVPVNVRTQ